MKPYLVAFVLCLVSLAAATPGLAQTPVNSSGAPGLWSNQVPPPAQPGGFQVQSASGSQKPNQPNSQQGGPNEIPPVDNQAINDALLNGLGQGGGNASGGASVDTARRALFKAALDSIFPFNPDEIKQLFDKLHENQNAIEVPAMGTPTPEVVAETVPLEPGSEPLTLDLDTGYVSTISFLDSTGAPWPIQDIGVGGNFDVPAPEAGGNVIRMTATSKYALGNMSIRLVGLISPLSFKLKATTGKVIYRYDARVPRFGPKASAPLIDHGNDLVAGDNLLMNILDGDPPLNSTRVTVEGVDTRTAAWRIGESVYVRTPYTLLSPGWQGSVGSADGTRVYLIPDTPVLLLSDNGNLIHARIGNNAKTDEQPVPAIEDGLAHPMRVSAAADPDDSASNNSSGSGAAPASSSPSHTLIRPVQVGGGPQQGAAPRGVNSTQGGQQ